MNELKQNLDRHYREYLLDVLKVAIEKKATPLVAQRELDPVRIDAFLEGMCEVYNMIENNFLVDKKGETLND